MHSEYLIQPLSQGNDDKKQVVVHDIYRPLEEDSKDIEHVTSHLYGDIRLFHKGKIDAECEAYDQVIAELLYCKIKDSGLLQQHSHFHLP